MATKTREISDFLVEGGADLAIVGEPHIKPGTLYPAMRHFREITNNSGSSAIGDMTTNAGIASAFNGMKYSHWNASARKDPSANAFIGKDWGSGNSNIVTRFKIWAPYNYPLAGNTAGKYMKLQGSNDNSSWTDLYEDPEVIGNYSIFDISTGITITTAYRYHRIFFEGDGNGGAVAELEFYTEDNPGRVYLADKETAHSGAYGTAQSDGKKYYYTDVEGSKPIKDPRIGAHFGSQRHNCGSLQTLEEETSYHSMTGRMDGHADNDRVASIDGREWCKAVGDVGLNYGGWGTALEMKSKSTFIEIVGYFNDANINIYAEANRTMRWSLDGAAENATNKPTSPLNETPHSSRFIDAGSLINLGLNTTVGIHTLKLRVSGSSDIPFYSFELIVNDTGSTARKKQINIPAQNVISYGKKFSIGSDTLTDAVHKHYDPFNGFSAGSNATTLGTFIDTATSLGMDNWKAGTSNYYRPFQGGRVVKWVASDGTIKTSVTMLPPNAQNIKQLASNAISNSEVQAGTNGETINFDTNSPEHSLVEVAKDFHFCEFGNGGANAHGTYKDASMTGSTTGQTYSYVMDDGTTAIVSAGAAIGSHQIIPYGDTGYIWVTFIGCGITQTAVGNGPQETHLAQNLPYGSHTLKFYRDGANPDITVDGLALNDLPIGTYGSFQYLTFYQPKMPPIPEDACIIADYILMADFVAIPADANFVNGMISKGTRLQTTARDIYYTQTSNITSNGGWGTGAVVDTAYPQGFSIQGLGTGISAGSATLEYPYFGTDVGMTGYTGRLGTTHTEYINSTSISRTVRDSTRNSRVNTTGQTLQLNGFKATWTSGEEFLGSIELAIPTHTPLHYQPFETPFLKELLGGDRNMEQTNLVVTPDGKTWDQATRDTSYIGKKLVATNWSAVNHSFSNTVGNEFRGIGDNAKTQLHTKDFSPANDRLICLKDGQYEIHYHTHQNTDIGSSGYTKLKIISAGYVSEATMAYQHDHSNLDAGLLNARLVVDLRRGDAVQLYTMHWSGALSILEITRL